MPTVEEEVANLVTATNNLISEVSTQKSNLDTSEANAAASAAAASTSEGNAEENATNAQLRMWEAEAERMTADSYATEVEDVYVKTYTSDGDGTFTASDTTEYSALHYSAKSAASSLDSADNISYNNTTSGMAATNVQDAVDELKVLHDSGDLDCGSIA